MHESFEPVETEAGIISGRDAIHLDEVRVSLYPRILELLGELNSSLCSKYKDKEGWIKYSLKFSGVLTFKMTELDLREYFGKTSFDLVANSEWLNELQGKSYTDKLKPSHKHYTVFTYDDVFDIICESVEMTLSDSRSK